ncbi:MAG: PRC-barrel domain-containing protein [Candidatus Heimdallarchaeota archaeon]|nr:PRC-barrel domain-containing protein [Candidatus Heimdallarchaeota archaeon]
MNNIYPIKFNEHFTFSQLRKKTVICKDGVVIGKIIDIIFKSDLNIHSLILGGNKWEELRETIRLKEDLDYVIPINIIESISSDFIRLMVPRSKIKDKLAKGIIPEGSFTFSSLKRKHIHDLKEKKFGRIVNLVFLPSGETILIIGGSWFEEISEKLKFKENSDLILPLKYIKDINEKRIRLSVPYEDLHIALDNKPMNEEAQRKYFDSQTISGNVEMRLIERRNAIQDRDFGRFQMKRT